MFIKIFNLNIIILINKMNNDEILLKELNKINEILNSKQEQLNYLSSQNNIDLIKIKELIYSPNVDINEKDYFGYSLLHKAIKHNKIDLIKLLLEHPNINVNNTNTCTYMHISTPLEYAVKENKHDIIQLLLAHPNINIKN